MAETYDITVEQGASYRQEFNYLNPDKTPINLTGYTARMQIRQCYESTDYVVSLTDGSGITITPLTGNILVEIDAVTTAGIEAGSYVYDLELVFNGIVTRLIQGAVDLTPEVTR